MEGDDVAVRVAAQKLAKNRRVVSEALKGYLDHTSALASLGEKAYLAGDWERAADNLFAALESDMPEAPLYYGLAYAHAQLGNTDHAYWYYLAFLRTSGIKPEKANRKPLELIEKIGPKPQGRPTAPDLDTSWRRFGEDERWDEAFLQLRNLIVRTPWAEGAYGILGDVYKTIDWDELAPHWRRRAKLARKVNRDRKTHERVHGVMAWPPPP